MGLEAHLTILQFAIGALAGCCVGFVLALVGGGGSILAVPLMVYAVGVHDPHVAVGTSAVAVAASAIINVCHHSRAGHVRWRIAVLFAAAGVLGAWAGSIAGRALAGPKLLSCFGVLMLLVSLMLLLRSLKRSAAATQPAPGGPMPMLPLVGLLTGAASGFFGIGGGFMIVPGLIYAAKLEILPAVATSLVAVAAFGATTAVSYQRAGFIDWPLAACFIGGSILGGLGGAHLARRLSVHRGQLESVFAVVLFLAAWYVIYRSVFAGALH